MKQWVEEQEQNMYDFIHDFSSSDYESISEGELEQLKEYQMMNEQRLLQKNFINEDKAYDGGRGKESDKLKNASDNMTLKTKINMTKSHNANGILNSSKIQNLEELADNAGEIINRKEKQFDKNALIRQLLSSYSRFEKRKILRPKPYFQNPDVPFVRRSQFQGGYRL